MNIQKENKTEDYEITFLPTEKKLGEIEEWLIEEEQKTGNGFYCNWNNIKASFDKNKLVTISLNNKTIGFASWQLITEKTARIEIAEIKPSYRNKGVGKKLTDELLNFLKDKSIYVVDLLCSPKESEPIWKSMGFLEFPELPEKYHFNSDNKKLYKILTDNLQQNTKRNNEETIELWNEEPSSINENTESTYIWYLEFLNGTRKLSKPIIQPANYHWRLCWKKNGRKIDDDKVKRFKTKIDFGSFIIIEELLF